MPANANNKVKIVSVGPVAPAPQIKIPAPIAPIAKKRSSVWICVYWVAIAVAAGAACCALSKINFGGSSSSKALPPLTEEPLRGADPIPVQTTAGDASEGYREAGKQKLLDGDAVGALNDFTLAVETNPNYPLNYIYRGEVLMSGSNFEAALSDFDAALRMERSVVAYYDRALAHIKLDNLAAAKSDLDRAIEEQYVYPETMAIPTQDIYAKRAQVNLWLRSWGDAEGDYTAAISATAGEPDWNNFTGRAEARTNMGNYENAVEDYVTAVTIISDQIQKTPDDKSRENMSRQAMGFFEKSGALRVKLGQMDMALQDLQAAHTLAIALDDIENKNRLQILMSNIQ